MELWVKNEELWVKHEDKIDCVNQHKNMAMDHISGKNGEIYNKTGVQLIFGSSNLVTRCPSYMAWKASSSMEHYLVGDWANPSEKWWSSSVGRMTVPTEWTERKNNSHVPNHQPVMAGFLSRLNGEISSWPWLPEGALFRSVFSCPFFPSHTLLIDRGPNSGDNKTSFVEFATECALGFHDNETLKWSMAEQFNI